MAQMELIPHTELEFQKCLRNYPVNTGLIQKAQDDSIALRLSEFIIAPEMLALSTGSILRINPAVPPPPLEEVVDHDELHEGGDEHGASTSHGIVSSAYVAQPPPHPPALQ
ncbi:hypothetical protein GH714_009414 [Hevea brasiliensis]|uniref:Uncharacterized protein n=1 Tax=Hevea brasiliensis TaxID=3981 RepID=A0A6A6NCK9_HEVBR|nr:hypothetical protein GH714_009414 [Hevea brasiliensis]